MGHMEPGVSLLRLSALCSHLCVRAAYSPKGPKVDEKWENSRQMFLPTASQALDLPRSSHMTKGKLRPLKATHI